LKIIHCSDLHLSRQEAGYCLPVLDEIFELTLKHKAEALLLAGDIFDSFDEAENLRTEFRDRLNRLHERGRAEVIMIAGNHESHGRKKTALKSFDFGPLALVEEPPFQIIAAGKAEIIAVPFQKEYADYINWEIPAKQSPYRIALAHATVPGLTYTGPDTEDESGILDPDFFRRNRIDYAALGHIHTALNVRDNGTILAYAGSARVWRKGELGPRTVNLLDPAAGSAVTPLTLQKAGQYRECDWPLNPDGSLPDQEREIRGWGQQDWVHIKLSGLVEEEGRIKELENRLISEHAPKVRKISVNRDEVAVLAGISELSVVRKFLKLWAGREPEPGDKVARAVWLKARQAGLLKIKEITEARP
jgi:DNA repair exonuclease SbcCD nuclease subunit